MSTKRELHTQEQTLHEIELAAWSERASEYDALFASVSGQAINTILDSLGDLNGKRHLDIACGTGHLVAAASERGAISEGIDFAGAMVAAAQANYPSERFQVAEASELPFGSQSFEAVSCAFGLSHMENPQAAANEAFRVLKLGGRFAFSLWYGPEDGNELIGIFHKAILRFAINPYELPDEWTRLRVADQQVCAAITRRAGFSAPTFKKLPIVWQASSAQQMVNSIEKLSVRTKMIINRQPPETQNHIREVVRSEVEARKIDGVVSFAWPALLTFVQKTG